MSTVTLAGLRTPGGELVDITLNVSISRAARSLAAYTVSPTPPFSLSDGQALVYTFSGTDQYGDPIPVSVQSVVSSNPAVLSATPAGAQLQLRAHDPGASGAAINVSVVLV